MKLFYRGIVIYHLTFTKGVFRIFKKLFLPLDYLVRMNLKTFSKLNESLLFLDSFKGYLCLES